MAEIKHVIPIALTLAAWRAPFGGRLSPSGFHPVLPPLADCVHFTLQPARLVVLDSRGIVTYQLHGVGDDQRPHPLANKRRTNSSVRGRAITRLSDGRVVVLGHKALPTLLILSATTEDLLGRIALPSKSLAQGMVEIQSGIVVCLCGQKLFRADTATHAVTEHLAPKPLKLLPRLWQQKPVLLAGIPKPTLRCLDPASLAEDTQVSPPPFLRRSELPFPRETDDHGCNVPSDFLLLRGGEFLAASYAYHRAVIVTRCDDRTPVCLFRDWSTPTRLIGIGQLEFVVVVGDGVRQVEFRVPEGAKTWIASTRISDIESPVDCCL